MKKLEQTDLSTRARRWLVSSWLTSGSLLTLAIVVNSVGEDVRTGPVTAAVCVLCSLVVAAKWRAARARPLSVARFAQGLTLGSGLFALVACLASQVIPDNPPTLALVGFAFSTGIAIHLGSSQNRKFR